MRCFEHARTPGQTVLPMGMPNAGAPRGIRGVAACGQEKGMGKWEVGAVWGSSSAPTPKHTDLQPPRSSTPALRDSQTQRLDREMDRQNWSGVAQIFREMDREMEGGCTTERTRIGEASDRVGDAIHGRS